jgi:hypothetical protein
MQADDHLVTYPFIQILRHWPAQARLTYVCAKQSLALNMRGYSSSDGFYFGQFWHGGVGADEAWKEMKIDEGLGGSEFSRDLLWR